MINSCNHKYIVASKGQIRNFKLKIMEGIFVPISFFLAVFAILYVFYTTRSRERIALVEKGLDASIFKTEPNKRRIDLVKWGIFMIALSVGVLLGFLLGEVINEVVSFFIAILLCGGVGLIIAYFATGRLLAKEQ